MSPDSTQVAAPEPDTQESVFTAAIAAGPCWLRSCAADCVRDSHRLPACAAGTIAFAMRTLKSRATAMRCSGLANPSRDAGEDPQLGVGRLDDRVRHAVDEPVDGELGRFRSGHGRPSGQAEVGAADVEIGDRIQVAVLALDERHGPLGHRVGLRVEGQCPGRRGRAVLSGRSGAAGGRTAPMTRSGNRPSTVAGIGVALPLPVMSSAP